MSQRYHYVARCEVVLTQWSRTWLALSILKCESRGRTLCRDRFSFFFGSPRPLPVTWRRRRWYKKREGKQENTFLGENSGNLIEIASFLLTGYLCGGKTNYQSQASQVGQRWAVRDHTSEEFIVLRLLPLAKLTIPVALRYIAKLANVS